MVQSLVNLLETLSYRANKVEKYLFKPGRRVKHHTCVSSLIFKVGGLVSWPDYIPGQELEMVQLLSKVDKLISEEFCQQFGVVQSLVNLLEPLRNRDNNV